MPFNEKPPYISHMLIEFYVAFPVRGKWSEVPKVGLMVFG